MSNFQLVLRLLLQLTVILLFCRGVAWMGRRWFGQTTVVSEMVAGVLLGPSLFGVIAPAAQAWLFPTAPLELADGSTIPNPSMSILFAISQLGLVLYMFTVGLEFDAQVIRRGRRTAAAISGSGIAVPFVLGGIVAVAAQDHFDLFGADVSPLLAAVFLGASVSITAFPMLARILYERGMAGTRVGTLALAAGAMDDAAAWCLLALVLAGLEGEPLIAVLAIGGAIVYVIAVVVLGRPALRRFTDRAERHPAGDTGPMAALLALILLCSWFTDAIGIYAVFGAFVLGAAMPRGPFVRRFQERTETLVTSLLLPVFFVYSGLNTQFGLVDSAGLWLLTLVVLAVAVIGKWGACSAAARLSGESPRDAATIGVLMNARGLMELIILNIGLERGVITPTLFTIMATMAIVTTLMTSPLVNRLLGPAPTAAPGTPTSAA